MNRTSFKWYEFDVNVINQINVVVSTNESGYIVKFQYCDSLIFQNFMSGYD